ncbi:MAG: ABC transporter permease, partial [Candidatus Aminicenantes bacterium]
MIKNYLKIAFRNIKRHKGYSFINIAGLAIGMACCILMVVYITSELGFDRYHENADRIYRLCHHSNIGGTDLTSGVSNA